jgi:hypothetical protein
VKESEQPLNMIEIEARITVEVRVENYEEVVRNEKGRLLGTVTRVPKVDSLVKAKVDETIEKEIKQNLEQTLPERLAYEVTKGLDENGVRASVDVSVSY